MSRLVTLPAAALLALTSAVLPAGASPEATAESESSSHTHTSRRIAGGDRYETASLLSKHTYGSGVAVAYVASGATYADALSAAPLAARDDAPLLLTRPGGLPRSVAEELTRLKPARIVVLGGSSAVSDAVRSHLRAYATANTRDEVTRVSGADRYATSAQVSAQYSRGVPVAYVATGADYPDALAAAAAAGRDGGPVLLTKPDQVPGTTAKELSRLRPQRIVVLGGAGAVSDRVASTLRGYATSSGSDALTRVAGKDRYATAAAVASRYRTGLSTAYLASGANFPDALAAGATAGATGAPVLLTRPQSLPSAVRTELDRLRPAEVVVMGGTGSVGDVLAPPAPAPAPSPAPRTGFPDADTTGVPAGVTLKPSGSLTITKNGTVIDGLRIEGNVVVNADNVVIRNSLIRSGGIAVRSNGDNLVIEDSEIDGLGKANPAVAYNDYTLRRVDIHNVAEGPRIAGGDVVIEDSYIHHLVQVGSNHTDAIQAVSGDNIRLVGNNVQTYNPRTGLIGNAAFQFGEEDGDVSACLVEGNLLNGGNLTVNGGGGGTTGAACTFRNNQFQRDFRYGAVGNLGPQVVWESSNVWFDTKKPVR